MVLEMTVWVGWVPGKMQDLNLVSVELSRCAVPLARISEATFSDIQYLSACVYFIEAKPECLEVPLRSPKPCLLISWLKKLRFRTGLSRLPKRPTANSHHRWAKVPSWAFSQCLVEITWVRSLLSGLLLVMSPDWDGTGAKELMTDVLPRFGADQRSQKRECPRRQRWCPMEEMQLRNQQPQSGGFCTFILFVVTRNDLNGLCKRKCRKCRKWAKLPVAPQQWTN